jgi:hypothetical protein
LDRIGGVEPNLRVMQQGPNHVTQREYQVDDDQFASEFLIPDEFRNIRQSKPRWNEFAQTIDAGAGQNMLQIVVLDLPRMRPWFKYLDEETSRLLSVAIGMTPRRR